MHVREKELRKSKQPLDTASLVKAQEEEVATKLAAQAQELEDLQQVQKREATTLKEVELLDELHVM